MLDLNKLMKENQQHTKNMINKIPKRIKTGDLAEVVLAPNAVRLRFSDDLHFYVSDPARITNIPGRTEAGYVTYIGTDARDEGYISLSNHSNKPENKLGADRTRYYFDALESCTKLRRKIDFKKILSSAFNGLAAVGRAYGSFTS